jgi:hypothetical protein
MKMKTKISDFFNMPINGKLCTDFKDGCDIEKAEKICIEAINAYDANQQEIALQDAQLIDANNEINDQKVEIAELKEMTGRLNEFLVKAFNEYNLTGSLSVKISLQGGTILTESETLLYGSEREGES